MCPLPMQKPQVPINTDSFNRYPFWAPRFWTGMRTGHWLRLLAQNRFRVHPSRLHWAAMTTIAAPFNSFMYGLQKLVYGRAIERTQLDPPPIFILGHWRSGTTFLHELLSRDDRHWAPSNYQVYAANHLLLSEYIATHYLRFLLPGKRPMDEVPIDWDSPQEDEWARTTMGMPSPYYRVAFAQQSPPFLEYLDMKGLTKPQIENWKRRFSWFLKCVTLQTKKRLVLKSPHNTGRIHVLREAFPNARFIHVARDPYAVFPSTLRMWRAFDYSQSLQDPHAPDLEQYVLDGAARMYRSFHEHRDEIPDNQIYDVCYEDLTRKPLEVLQGIYQHLDLGDFDQARPRFAEFLRGRKHYVTNRHELPDYWRQQIRRSWAEYIERYGYTEHEAAATCQPGAA